MDANHSSSMTEISPGHKVARGERGQIIKGVLSPERASEMAKQRALNTKDAEALSAALCDLVLEQVPENKQKSMKLLIGRLAAEASKSGGQAMKAVEACLNLVGHRMAQEPPLPNEKCPLCGRLDTPIILNVDGSQLEVFERQEAILEGQFDDRGTLPPPRVPAATPAQDS